MRLFFLLLLSVFFGVNAFSQASLKLTDNIENLPIGLNCVYFEDTSGKISAKDIGHANFENKFLEIKTKKTGFIYSKGNIWAKINIKSQSEKEWLLEINNATIDTVSFYLVQNNQIISAYKSGDHLPFEVSLIKSANPIFPLKLSKNQTYSIYLRGNSTEELDFKPTIWEANKLYEHLANRQLLWGIFFGFILVISLYNFFLWLTTKHKIYLFYVIYVLAFGLFQASLYGFGYQYFWSNHPFNEKAHITFFGISLTFLTLFSLYFLDIFKVYPNSKRYFKIGGIIWLFVLAYIVFTFDATSRIFISIISVIGLILQFYFSLKLYLHGNRSVRFYVLATIAFSIASIIIILKNFVSWFPGDFYLKLGSMIEMVLFSVALGDKYRFIEKETIRQQKIRSDIASNLHDDLAASLSSLTLFSEMNRMKIQKIDPNLKGIFENISSRSRDMMRQVREAVWEIKPENDASDEWVDRMLKFANETLTTKKIDFIANISLEIENIKLTIDARRNVYFIFKEAINNAAKYSEAQAVTMVFFVKNREIILQITDNGKGFDLKNNKEGNGLINFEKRAKDLGGSIAVKSEIGEGTEIKLIFRT